MDLKDAKGVIGDGVDEDLSGNRYISNDDG